MYLIRRMIDGLKDILGEHPLIVTLLSVTFNWIAGFQEPIIWILTALVLLLTLLVKIEEYRKYLRERRKDDGKDSI
jgi:hypothetical protein